jgi:hypothetical protein
MLKTVGQILVSDDPYKPEQVGEGKAPSIDTTAEVVDEKTE